jgi:serine/threonine protein phosphatase PrpC
MLCQAYTLQKGKKSMNTSSFIAKIRRGVFVQAGLPSGGEQVRSLPARIQRRIHLATDEEVLQHSANEGERQWPLSSAPASPPHPVRDEPMIGMPAGKPEQGQMDMEGPLSLSGAQQRNDDDLILTVGALSHAGITRQHKPNEDSLFAVQGVRTHSSPPQPFGLFIVADGMGGHAHGQEASRLAVQTIIERVLPKLSGSSELNDAGLRQLLVDGVQAAHQAIHQRNMEQGTAMGTTLTAALVVGATAYLVNVGDSRIYLYRESNGLRKLTNDHSVAAWFVGASLIQPADVYTHPQRNQLYRSLGHDPSLIVDAFIEPLQPDDILLLCSDGLWAMVRDPRLQQILSSVSETSLLGRALLEAALQGGGADNISLIVVRATRIVGDGVTPGAFQAGDRSDAGYGRTFPEQQTH